MTDNVLSALEYISVSELSRADWIAVGMALKDGGYSVDVWDAWSRNDTRYHVGECERKWNSFHGNSRPVTAGTIVQMAIDRGWSAEKSRNTGMGWNDEIEYDGESKDPDTTPVDELKKYIKAVFRADDHVGYVTGDVFWDEEHNKWNPGRGMYDRTAAELLESLEKHPDDIGATMGDWKPDAGAWIHFNPLDGHGVKNDDVTAFRYALVECDSISLNEQEMLYRKYKLPAAALVYSGGKSIHAIVHIDADDIGEYRKRVEFLYDFLDKHDCPVDKQNKNPSRLSRMPGVTRNGKKQRLISVNTGFPSWREWYDYAQDKDDDLPGIKTFEEYAADPPAMQPELIHGILRRGHKMLISGSSKAGKSFLLMELSIALAEGSRWLGLKCEKSKVLYINLEIDEASCVNRFIKIYKALNIKTPAKNSLMIWNLRGHSKPIDKLVPKIVRRVKDNGFDAIIIDPIYKVLTGDENSASDMSYFCGQFDRLASETGCSIIYCHHHSKGAQGAKRAMDRASGSGVFARDPDAQLDMIELQTTKDMDEEMTFMDDDRTPWRLETSLREFANPRPIDFWFKYPVHVLDKDGLLERLFPVGSSKANLTKGGKYNTPEERLKSLETAFGVCSINEPVRIKDMADYLGVSDRCIRDRIKEFPDRFFFENGIVFQKSNS